MTLFSTGMAAVMATAAMGIAALRTSALAPPLVMPVFAERRASRISFDGLQHPASYRYPNGPGWGVRQVKRMKAKRAGVALNKARHRRARGR